MKPVGSFAGVEIGRRDDGSGRRRYVARVGTEHLAAEAWPAICGQVLAALGRAAYPPEPKPAPLWVVWVGEADARRRLGTLQAVDGDYARMDLGGGEHQVVRHADLRQGELGEALALERAWKAFGDARDAWQRVVAGLPCLSEQQLAAWAR